MATINLPFAASATRRVPDADELANGFGCGPADKELFDYLVWWLTGQVATAITEGGLTVDDALLPRLAQAIQSGKSTYAVATGTANAWTVAPSLAVPAYAAGRVLNIIAPATNTSTTVNMNVSGLGTRRIKKADGTDPGIGDLVSGRMYATIDDGTNIRILNPTEDSIVRDALFPQMTVADATSFSSTAGIETAITNWDTPVGDPKITAGWNPANSTFTVPAGMGGLWYALGYISTLSSGQVPTNGHGLRLKRNGSIVNAGSSPAGSIVHCTAMAMRPMADGDTYQLLNVPDDSSIFIRPFTFTLIRFGKAS